MGNLARVGSGHRREQSRDEWPNGPTVTFCHDLRTFSKVTPGSVSGDMLFTIA